MPTQPEPAFARTSSIVGMAAWIVLAGIRTSTSNETELINKILLLGVLVILPLGLFLVATADRNDRHSLVYRLAVRAQPLGAASAVGSFFLEHSFAAALLAAVWFVITVFTAIFGLQRLLPRGLGFAEEVSIDAGLIFLPIGGVWFVLSRLGIQPLGFGDTIVLLTAVHFHFAAFAALILAGLAGRVIGRNQSARRLHRLAVFCLILGVPLVAAGITVSPLLALAGAVTISSGLLLLAVVVVGWALRVVDSWPAKILLIVSSVSSASAMVLASAYAYSIVAKRLIVDIPQMAMSHGIMNSVGFALCGLTAWLLVEPGANVARPGLPFSKLSSGWFVGPNYFDRVGAISQSKPETHGLVDSFSIYRRADFDTDAVPPAIKSFYEETFRYRLIVRPHWRRGFHLGGRIAHWLGTAMGQMRLPILAEHLEDRIASRLLSVSDDRDGRTGVRAWIRTYEATDQAMYVAAYATHFEAGAAYMNIAFPVCGGNIASILYLSHSSASSGAIALSTLPGAQAGGDQGVYFANQIVPIRLPMNEVITVWETASHDKSDANEGRPMVGARHEMWLCGIKFLELEYDIFPVADDSQTT